MTPSEWLGFEPARDVLVHEAGHLTVGLALKLSEGGIQFMRRGGSDVARAEFSRRGHDSMSIILRSLAGMYSQALICPESVRDLGPLLVEHKLFTRDDVFEENGLIDMLMKENGFEGDWKIIRNTALVNFGSARAANEAEQAHSKLAQIMKRKKLPPVISAIADDIRDWLVNDDPEVLGASPALFYSINRANSIYAAHC